MTWYKISRKVNQESTLESEEELHSEDPRLCGSNFEGHQTLKNRRLSRTR
uniref:Uncharacterized protein n=1 Tax=Medicago truncatula TaxID=3880 RepID=A2Q699_MEDTR|nr:hypothetical protein MtrDRAFT_AC174465g6v2 [Medicago truncatula]